MADLFSMLQNLVNVCLAQLNEKLSKRRYRAAIIIVDYNSRLCYIHLMKNVTSEETVMAKKAFKRFAESKCMHGQNYQCDIDHFADNAFIDC